MKPEEILEELETCLKEHDWTYSMSDDGRMWRRGRDQREHIDKLFVQLADLGKEKEAKELFKKYAPVGF